LSTRLRALVLIPTYNERENLPELVERLSAVREELPFSVLFVDDGSPDGTPELIREYMGRHGWIDLVVRVGERGLGTALLRGYKYALERGYDVLVQMDADLQHPPELIPRLVSRVAGGCDAVVASRYIEGGGFSRWPLHRRVVSRVANWYARAVLGLGVRDATSGFRAFSRRALEAIVEAGPRCGGYAFQVETLAILSRAGMRLCEEPFVFARRERGSSKLGAGEIVRFAAAVVGMRFRRRRPSHS